MFSLPAPVSLRGISQNFRNPLVHKWNFAVQQEVWRDTALELAYIGNHQAHQIIIWDANSPVNNPNPDLPTDSLRPVPYISGTSTVDSFGRGNYAALATKLEKRFSKGSSYLISYTYGHALSNVGTTLGGSRNFGLTDPYNFDTAYSSAAWDIRHSLVASFIYDLPIGQGKLIGSNWSGPLNAALGNWQLNGIATFRTGAPYSIGTSKCVGHFAHCGPNLVPGKSANAEPSNGRSPDHWFDTSVFSDPTPGTQGNTPIQTNNDPGQRQVDLSLFKDFRVTERFRVQFRGEAFNIANTPQWGGPDATQGDANFGRITSTQVGTERHFQFSLRLFF